MSHKYTKMFDVPRGENVAQQENGGIKPLENQADSIGLSSFNKDNEALTKKERIEFIKRETERLVEKKNKMVENRHKKEVIPYEGD